MSGIKAEGATYTPTLLADFVARQMLEAANLPADRPLRILDPAIGHAELLLALLAHLDQPVEIYGFETDPVALTNARTRLQSAFPDADLKLVDGSFLDHVLDDFACDQPAYAKPYDLIIANPPYVRTQIMGAGRAKLLTTQFGLSGRVDLYHAFLLAMAKTLAPGGTAGFIVSNRFMTTKGGAATRTALLSSLRLAHIVDFGDTKLFGAAVLPAVLIARGCACNAPSAPKFTSIYQTKSDASHKAENPVAAIAQTGIVALPDGRHFSVNHGHLDNGGDAAGVWRLASEAVESWLKTVAENTWGTFRDIGKIRVGVKTCADKVFIPKIWETALELHRPLTTHHIARRFRPQTPNRKILYPHESVGGQKRPVEIENYPLSLAYLETHRATLEARRYVMDTGRRWYEIWVPQNPADWALPKLVFRDIAEQPTFWMDRDATVVNGDCYWLTGPENLLWLALAIGNSTFIEQFYDHRFNNKLYAGRRRFITQYVEHFPLPDPAGIAAQEIIALSKAIYQKVGIAPTHDLEKILDQRVWTAFGLPTRTL